MSESADRRTEEVCSVLEEMRQKLLDLSARNRLLNFRHTRTNCARVVDELPNQLFKTLLDGKAFRFDPVVEPTTAELRDYYAVEQSVPSSSIPPSELRLPKPEVWAQHCGIEVEYELPFDLDDEPSKQHTDKRIQTLLYPSTLDTRLRKLRADARTAIEETGTNLLYVAFGFLDWRDARQADKGMLAPLVLVPVELDRIRVKGGKHTYHLSWTGEDLQPNLSLQKKLRDDFSLELPTFRDDLAPESYFKAVRKLIEGQSAWRVRRYATLALFQFGKLLLYLDLDPEAWPIEQKISDNSIVQRIVLGQPAGGSAFSSTEPPSVDDIDLKLELVDRADSTQSAALVRALSGETMVVQGPPGTGKSQTITNLIAAALARGKKVLFVSEKLAALEVVRRRLDELRLGDFVLELHSHKTRKQALINDIGHRLNARERHTKPHEIENERRQLHKYREKLQHYVADISAKLGALDWPVSDILFEAGRIRLRLGDLVNLAPSSASFEPLVVSEIDRKAAHQTLEACQLAIQKAARDSALAEHPWAGVSSEKVLGASDRQEVVEMARAWRAALQVLMDYLNVALSESNWDVEPDNDLVKDFTRLSVHSEEVVEFFNNLKAGYQLAKKMETSLGIQFDSEVEMLLICRSIVLLAQNAPSNFDQVDRTLLLDDSIDTRLEEIARIHTNLVLRREKLQRLIRLSTARDFGSERLRRISTILSRGGLFRWLSPNWREARRSGRSLLIEQSTSQPSQIRLLREAASCLDDEMRFFSDAESTEICGDHLETAKSRIESARSARKWIKSVETEFGRGLSSSAHIGRTLINLDIVAIRDLGAVSNQSDGQALIAVSNALAQVTMPEADKAAISPWQSYLAHLTSHRFSVPHSKLEGENFRRMLQHSAQIASAARIAEVEATAFKERVDLDLQRWNKGNSSTINNKIELLDRAVGEPNRLLEWLEVDIYLRREKNPGVSEIIEIMISGGLPGRVCRDVFDHMLFDGLSRTAFERRPSLKMIGSGEQDDLRQMYSATDERLMELCSREIASKLVHKPIPSGNSGSRVSDLTEFQLIQREVAKQKRHIPIRQLVARAGKALQAMKPCFMMGPLSVAQYLPAGALNFDLVVFDEASQVRPEEAIGALARGQQAVIVGDSRQLPPTNFFQRTGESDQDEDHGAIAVDIESILEAAETRFPSEMLRWHYRSQHPKLIEFSNSRFYDGRLTLFPSPRRDDRSLGLKFHFVSEGVFESHVNRAEAEAIADAVALHLRTQPGRSLGVVAMNIQQRDLIETKVDRLLQNEPELLEHAEDLSVRQEPFFVKNLENVQGDERDVVFISMTYGPAEKGARVQQYFGPINGASGWRRLNVLFSRSKRRMEIFSSIRESDIAPGETSQRGPRELKEFLRFAETGLLSGSPTNPGKAPDSEFEIAVMEGLVRSGYECVPQVGSAGFYIDIGVVDPDEPNAFIVGVECDGATYHSSKSARDRDRLRQEILERLGWTIERVWSTNWFRDPDREFSRLVTKIEAAITVQRDQDERRQARMLSRQVTASPEVKRPRGYSQRDLPIPEPLLIGQQSNTRNLSVDEKTISTKTWSTSENDARRILLKLREEIENENPEMDETKSILRKAMIDELLLKRPADEGEFLARIRLDLREGTHGPELKRYGERIFSVLERIE